MKRRTPGFYVDRAGVALDVDSPDDAFRRFTPPGSSWSIRHKTPVEAWDNAEAGLPQRVIRFHLLPAAPALGNPAYPRAAPSAARLRISRT